MRYDPENERHHRASEIRSYHDGKTIVYQYGISVISDRVIRKQAYSSTRLGFETIQALCQHFMRQPHPSVVPIYDFQAEVVPESKWDAHRYHYDMMRMGALDQEEKWMISRVTDNWWRHHQEPDRERYFNQFRGAYNKLVDFLQQIMLEGRYLDLHNGNIMKDEDDQYRLIDLEGFSIFNPMTDPRNDWLRE